MSVRAGVRAGCSGMHTIVVAVQFMEHEPQFSLVGPQVLRELLKVQQAIVVGVALTHYLQGQAGGDWG